MRHFLVFRAVIGRPDAPGQMRLLNTTDGSGSGVYR